MPRKEYKTITVKSEAFQKFVKAIKEAKREDPSLDNRHISKFTYSQIPENPEIVLTIADTLQNHEDIKRITGMTLLS